MNISIEEATLDQLDLLMNIRREVLSNVFGEEFQKLSKDEINQIREYNRKYYLHEIPLGRHIAYLCYNREEVIGCGALCLYDEMPSPDNINGKCAYLMNIYVKKDYRRRGIGTRIVQHLIGKAKELKVNKIYLETSDDARLMYEKMGFIDMNNYMQYNG